MADKGSADVGGDGGAFDDLEKEFQVCVCLRSPSSTLSLFAQSIPLYPVPRHPFFSCPTLHFPSLATRVPATTTLPNQSHRNTSLHYSAVQYR